ncbi:MAG: hypothetical protein RL118_704 [Actinomycetota bacterium]
MRRIAAEFLGTALLLCVVIGSGIAAEELTQDAAVRGLVNASSIGLGLAALIWWFAPISGAHFNPVVTLAARARREVSTRVALENIAAQLAGAVVGTMATNWMFGLDPVQVSTRERITPGTFVSEILATALLIAIIAAIGQRGAGAAAPAVIGAFITSAIFFTSSTIFANPAVTLGRVLSDTLTGIEPVSASWFALAQILALPLGLGLGKLFKA